MAIGVYWSTYGTDINPNFEELSGEDREEFAENNNDYTAESVTFTSMILHWMHQWRLAALFMISEWGLPSLSSGEPGRYSLQKDANG